MSRYHIPEFRADPREVNTSEPHACEACGTPTKRSDLVKRGTGCWVDYVCPACAQSSRKSKLENLL